MKKNSIYIETSVFGFYYDEELKNKIKSESTRKLFKEIEDDLFYAVTSPLTVLELSKTPNPTKRILLSLIKNYSIKVINVDEEELVELVRKYMEEKIVPQEFINDARHVAYATLLKVDILVTLNLKHLANEWNVRKFDSVNLKEGYSPVIIRTPEEVIHYEN